MNILFGIENTAVAAEGNPELFEIGREHDEMLVRYNALNEEMADEEVPSSPSAEDQARYDAWKTRVHDLQVEMLAWEARAKRFIGSPSLEFICQEPPDKAEQRHLQSHIVHYLSMLRNDIAASRFIIVNNYQRIVSEAEGNRNLKIAMDSYKLAIKSYRVAMVGLAFALLGLLVSFLLSSPGCTAV